MADLMGKLNTLVRSSVHGFLGGGDSSPRKRRGNKPPSLARLGKDIDQEIAALRQQINKALDDEDHQEAAIQALQRQIADWDAQADQALSQGNEAVARHAVGQMQIQQRRLTMLEAELEQHRISTSELINRVNELEALVAEARQETRQEETLPTEQTAPLQTDEDDETLSARLRRVRHLFATQEMEVVNTDSTPLQVEEAAVDDDLARRRARLSQ